MKKLKGNDCLDIDSDDKDQQIQPTIFTDTSERLSIRVKANKEHQR